METTSRYQDFTDESGSSIDSSEFRGHLCGPRSGFTDYSELPRCKLRQSLTTRSRKDDQEIQEAKIHRGARAYRAAKLWMRAPRPTEVSLLAIIVTVVTLLIYTNIHLRRLIPHNDIQRIVASWGTPNSPTVDEARWPTDFSRDIIPIPCHSHNDYWRRVPLFDALAAGCTSIEADVWLTSNGLLVGHDPRSLTLQRTLASLYIDPLTKSLSHQNNNSTVLTNDSTGTSPRGIFDTQPSTPITLLIDIKTDGPKTFGAVLASLEPLRSQGWLTHFNGTTVIPGLVTVVGSGNTPFDLLATNTSYRDLFFDAPLDALWGEDTPTNSTIYTSENSYYASVSFEKSIGKLWKGIMTPMQIRTVQGQIQAASERGLKARYWDTPSWPRGQRGHVWDVLTRENVGILNVDDLEAASRYSW